MKPGVSKKTILALCASFIILALLSVFAWFLYSKIENSSIIISSAEARIAFLEKETQEFSLAEANLRNFGPQINLLSGSFVTEKTFVSFIELLETSARKTNVAFSAQTANLPASPQERASLSFEVKGNFSDIVNFFALLDKIPYAGIADTVTFSKEMEIGQKTPVLAAKARYIIFNFIQQ